MFLIWFPAPVVAKTWRQNEGRLVTLHPQSRSRGLWMHGLVPCLLFMQSRAQAWRMIPLPLSSCLLHLSYPNREDSHPPQTCSDISCQGDSRSFQVDDQHKPSQHCTSVPYTLDHDETLTTDVPIASNCPPFSGLRYFHSSPLAILNKQLTVVDHRSLLCSRTFP